MKLIRLALARLIVIGGALALLVIAWRTLRPELPAAERGRRLAEKTGCFACHGPEGTRGTVNPGRTDVSVPTFEDDVMMYAKTREEIREWIHDGSTARRRASAAWRDERENGALRMQAFGTRLTERQIDDLVAFVTAASGPKIPDSLARSGIARAEKLGCTGCHGQGGRLARRNPGSLKGYVPSWDGPDFAELVRDSTEFRQWVEKGVSRRFDRNPAARYFLNRAVLRMPAFKKHLEPADVPALWAYVTWLRHS
ncbi:MAG: c-type cytochrome [Candidatus Eisenbacteria bacterium]|nr:c-type cytochrome [Candidatus Eisenbacteria bacterium]